jgi:hypothetical protein
MELDFMQKQLDEWFSE